jgi:hypothetical protein
MNTTSTLSSVIGVPAVSPMYSSARTIPAFRCGSGLWLVLMLIVVVVLILVLVLV